MMPPIGTFYRCLDSGVRIPREKIGDGIVSINAAAMYTHQLLFCFFSFQVDCSDASDERSLVAIVERAEEESIGATIDDMNKANKANGITVGEKSPATFPVFHPVGEKVDGGGGVKKRPGHNNITIGGVEQQKQPPTIDDVANKSLLTGQPPPSSCGPCYGFDDGDWPGILLFGKLLKKKTSFDKIPDGMFYLGLLASKKIADETRKFCRERARNPDTTLCSFTKQRLRDYFWLSEEPRAANNGESGATVDVLPMAIELTEKPLMTRRKMKAKRATAATTANNKSITTSEKVAKKKDEAGGSTESLPPLPLNNNDDDL